jgi:hypothetical protein
MARRTSRRLLKFEPPRVATSALSLDERTVIRTHLDPAEALLATVRAWDGEMRLAWALTPTRVLVATVERGTPRVTSIPLDDIVRLDSQPAGIGTALWLYTGDQLFGLHLANEEEAECFVQGLELLQREAMVLRIVK